MDLTGMWRRSKYGDTDGVAGAHEDLFHQVNAAHREWVTAQQFFQRVSEPELVDLAVQSISAAEQKYMFLLRRAREQHVQVGYQA